MVSTWTLAIVKAKSTMTKPTLPYAELDTISNFSFLEGGSHPEELIEQAAKLKYYAVGICDQSSFAGIVRAYAAAQHYPELKFLVGCRITVLCEAETQPTPIEILAYPKNRRAYGHLCRILSTQKRAQNTPRCTIPLHTLENLQECHLILLPQAKLFASDKKYSSLLCKQITSIKNLVRRKNLSIAIYKLYEPDEARTLESTIEVAQSTRIRCVVTNRVLYHSQKRQALQDILTCIKNKYLLTTLLVLHLTSVEDLV